MKWWWMGIYFGGLVWSGVEPRDRFTWLLEVIPALVGGLVLLVTRRSFPLTPLTYGLILAHCIILMVGGHYTYAEVPLFNWLKDVFHLARNNYDKLGHLAQGFVPAIIARELLIRNRVVNGAGWRNFFIVCFCLALSALYELIEWGVAVGTGSGADAFLGTQGYLWDTQSDMAMALIGSLTALVMLRRIHDRQLDEFTG
ncbi:MAG TPA: DUF2238 domain-containing protein [Desulfobulbaceae bacterium]|nr:DUF2238 domain-containing protein [Desulfobulbaceae bacterium]